MSVRTMARVWADSVQSGSHLLMLLAIADFADDDGCAYPSVAGLAEKCRMKPRNANYVLADLQTSGELCVRVNKGPRGKNLYQIMFAGMRGLQAAAPLQPVARVQTDAGVQGSAPLHSSARTPALACAKPLHSSAAEPSLNHHEPPKVVRTKRAASELGVEFLIDQGCDHQHAADWLAVRKAKRTLLTKSAWEGLCREAKTAGIEPAQAVAICAAKGWQGFDASWGWQDASGKRQSPAGKTFAERDAEAARSAASAWTGGLLGQPLGQKFPDAIDMEETHGSLI